MHAEVHIITYDLMRSWVGCRLVAIHLIRLTRYKILLSGKDNTLTALSTVRFKNENGVGCSSPLCFASLEKSIVFPSSRAGVPVWSRPSLNPASFKDAERPRDGASPMRPAGERLRPEERLGYVPGVLNRQNYTNVDFTR